MMGFSISGIADLLELTSIPIHVQKEEAELVDKVTQVGQKNLVTHESGDKITVGSIDIELIHTPGHTPGSQCFLVDDQCLAVDRWLSWAAAVFCMPEGPRATCDEVLRYQRFRSF